jgi:hypothetical protein
MFVERTAARAHRMLAAASPGAAIAVWADGSVTLHRSSWAVERSSRPGSEEQPLLVLTRSARCLEEASVAAEVANALRDRGFQATT